MRQVIRLRKLDIADRQEQEAILDLYMSALGMGRDVSADVEVRASRLIAQNEPVALQ